MFLAVYFRPSDAYCIHIDTKVSPDVLTPFKRVVTCYQEKFPQAKIFFAERPIPVYWGKGGSIMEADMICFKQLLQLSDAWKMGANIAGTELPFVSHQKFREVMKRSGGNIMPRKIYADQTGRQLRLYRKDR